MKTYSNKSDRVNAQKCLYSEINKSSKSRKTAERFKAKKEIKTLII